MAGKYVSETVKMRIRFRVAIGCFFVHACAFLLMPAAVSADGEAETRIYAMLVGILFWVGLLSGCVLMVLAERRRRKRSKEPSALRGRPGVLSFFSNPAAKAADAVMLSALAAFCILCIAKAADRYIAYVVLAILVFSFDLHAIWNGKTYNEIRQKSSIGGKQL